MKMRFLIPLLALAGTVGACSSGGFDDGDDECSGGAHLRFEPALAGQGTTYSISVDTDFGVTEVNFDVPFVCVASTGFVEERSGYCSSVPDEEYGSISADEVFPPLVTFKSYFVDGEPADDITGLTWGYDSEVATVVVEKDGLVIHEGTVTFETKICNSGSGDVSYQEAVIDVTSGGEGGQGGSN